MAKTSRLGTTKTPKAIPRADPPPRPEYQKFKEQVDDLVATLQTIVDGGKDAKGQLGPKRLQQAKVSLRSLKAAQLLLECPQGLGPYDPNP